MNRRRIAILVAAAAIALVLVAIPGLATSSVKSYTGCLKAGTLVNIKAGNRPSAPCGSKPTVHFSGGDVTAVTAGTGLSGGATNGAASLAVRPAFRLPQSCGDGKVAQWSSGSGLWTCGTLPTPTHEFDLQSYCSLVTANPESYEIGPCNGHAATLASTGTVGRFSSITVGTDGNPVMSYHDQTNTNLKVMHCGNASCSSGNEANTVDTAGSTEMYTSIAIGTDGNPVVSYQAGSQLNVVHCTNASCSSFDTPTLVDDGGGNQVGRFNSIAIGTDGNPVVSYHDDTAELLKVVHCTNISCSSFDTPITLDSGGVGQLTSIAIGTDGNPVVSYDDYTNGNIKVAHCGNTACSSGNDANTLVSGGATSIAIGTDGNPVVSYYDLTNDDLMVAHCTNASCSSFGTPVPVDTGGNVGLYSAIAIGTDGNPVVSYYDVSNGDLKVAHCGNTTCSAGNTHPTVDSGGNVGRYTSTAVGVDGVPVVSYYDVTNSDLRLARPPIS